MTRLSRRAFLQGSCLTLLSAAGFETPLSAQAPPALRVALVTDVHYADAKERGTRFYRESLAKLGEAAGRLGEQKPALAIELGDFIDSADKATAESELGYLKTIDGLFAKVASERHYVLGNHCVSTLTKPQFLGGVNKARSFYSFDRMGVHFVILDACFRKDGEPYGNHNFEWTDTDIPEAEREWLSSDLKANRLPTFVFVHQRLDTAPGNAYTIRSADKVRSILEANKSVQAVFMGHSHQNEYNLINGIHYVTLAAMVEGSGEANNGYSVLNISKSGTARLEGFRKHEANNATKIGLVRPR